ncbi:DHHA2 domain protein [Collinsella intestinalis DSM 13280]|uniref:DHHA2 domain protein n=2 Tax=Collinsella intestinalis TaxID=147207 RepID=C4FAH9_9ACTN|nr:DHHA2 domain protein [Collinsella intestinalis DSM 13280]
MYSQQGRNPMANVLVFGHQNPDNDAIMSTVVLSQLLNQLEYQGNTYTACCLGPLPAESAKLLEDAGVPAPTLIDAIEPAAEGAEPQLVILTDHNEPGQSVAGLENATVFGVVDHHRFGDFTTAAPLHIVALPWGSSCSIVAKLFEVMGVEPTDTQAKLLLSAMMTDTLMLKSPTATAVDAAIAAKLGEQLGVDPVKFGMEVFLTRPSGSFTAEQMVGNDIKMFEVAGTKLLIGQYETVDKSRALGMIPEIREAMRAYQAEKAADGIVLCITDIMEEGSQVLLEGDTATAQKGLQIEDVAEGVWMPGVLSRKKQVAAPILAAN